MMHQTAKFPLTFIPEANCQILCLQYEGNELSMFIMLPNDMEDHVTGLVKVGLVYSVSNMGLWPIQYTVNCMANTCISVCITALW